MRELEERRQADRLATTRRGFVIGSALAAATLPLQRAWAQETKPGADAKVFLDYTQKALDDAYDQRVWAKNAGEVIKRYGVSSKAVQAKYKHETKSYGASPDETLDIYPPVKNAGGAAPIHVFIHGGAWRGGTKDLYAFPAPVFAEHGAIYVALNFGNIPKVRLPEMAHQVRGAIAWIYKNAKTFGGDPERIYVSGHSSGGHLCGVVCTTDWARYGVPQTVLKGAVSVSGMYDLYPVMLSARSSYVKISKEEMVALSAERHLSRIACPIIVAHGDKESPEFQRQSRHFAAIVQAQVAQPCEYLVGKGYNHFEVIETLGTPQGVLGAAALKQMKLA
ncbi:MAG: alpha/beta hydrolase [Rhodospirillaceae bacterium]|nr:alpha/beta hydrolase [Rhodospirillaceae bacterium]